MMRHLALLVLICAVAPALAGVKQLTRVEPPTVVEARSAYEKVTNVLAKAETDIAQATNKLAEAYIGCTNSLALVNALANSDTKTAVKASVQAQKDAIKGTQDAADALSRAIKALNKMAESLKDTL